ncbi:MAG: O-antigen ligase family protein [Hyphomicrobiales bacterium]
MALCALAPRGAYLWAVATGLSLFALHIPPARPLPGLGSATAALLAFTAWAAASAIWSAEASASLSYPALAALLILLTAGAARWSASAPPDRLRAAVAAMTAGLAAGFAFILVECATDQWLSTLVVDRLEFLRPGEKHLYLTDGSVVGIGKWVLNRSLTALSLLLWPALLLLAARGPAIGGRGVRIALVALTGVAIFCWVHESSKLAFAFGLATFALAALRPGIGRRAAIAGWIVATLLVIPVMHGLFAARLHTAEWLPLSARARVVLWHYTADRYLEAPVIGIGARSTKIEFQQRDRRAEWPEDYPYPLQTGRHSHNVFLQTWYELGAAGALLLFLAGLAVLRAIARLDPSSQPYALAAFASATAMASASYGLWQAWFLGLIGLAAILTSLGAAALRRKTAGG